MVNARRRDARGGGDADCRVDVGGEAHAIPERRPVSDRRPITHADPRH